MPSGVDTDKQHTHATDKSNEAKCAPAFALGPLHINIMAQVHTATITIKIIKGVHYVVSTHTIHTL